MEPLYVKHFIKQSKLPILPLIAEQHPWDVISKIDVVINKLIETLDLSDYTIQENQVIHNSAVIESNAQLKGPMIIGPSCFIANGSLLRGGVVLDASCIVGHCSEIKTSIFLSGSKAAHLNFVGDSIIGNQANIEAGAIIANYRNELTNKEIVVCHEQQTIATGVDKFGSILGDHVKLGANSTLAPGTILPENYIVKRGECIEQSKLLESH